jgi:two-component system, sensor histidine kinase PdtaS
MCSFSGQILRVCVGMLSMAGSLIFPFASASGQNTGQRDASAPGDTNFIRYLLQRASTYYDTEWNYTNKVKIDSALPLLEKALEISHGARNLLFEHQSNIDLGKYYFRCDNIPMAQKFFHQAITLDSISGNKALEASAWYEFADRTPAINGEITQKLFYYNKSLTLYNALKDWGKEVDIYLRMAVERLTNGQPVQARKDLQRILQLQGVYHDRTQYKSYNYLGMVEAGAGNYNIAVNYGLAALKALQPGKDRFIESQIYCNLGKWYLELEQSAKSLEYFTTAIEKFQELSSTNIHQRFYAYSLLRQTVQVMIKTGAAKQAITFVQKKDAQMFPGTDYAKQFTYGALADCYEALGQYSRAELYYMKAVSQALHNGRVSNSQNEYFKVAAFYNKLGDFPKAKRYIEKFMSIKSDAKDINKLREIQHILFRIDSAAGRYISAIEHYRQYKQLNDSIFSVKKSKQIEELHIQYETVQKEQSIQLLRNREKLQQSEIATANFNKKFFIAGLVCLAIVLLLLYNDYLHKAQKNRLLIKQQDTISRKNSSLQDLVNEKERLLAEKNLLLDEKEWLLKEIHHRVKNSLQIVISLLYSQSKRLKDEEAISAFRESQQRIHSVALMHQKLYLSNNLKHINMDDYIGELVAHLSDAFDITGQGIRFHLNIGKVNLALSQAIPVGLILNEAITNAIKYAFPREESCNIYISLMEDFSSFVLEISDNGKGFPEHFDAYRTDSLGMTLIRGLSDQLEADCVIMNMNGVTIRIRFLKEKGSNDYMGEHAVLPASF